MEVRDGQNNILSLQIFVLNFQLLVAKSSASLHALGLCLKQLEFISMYNILTRIWRGGCIRKITDVLIVHYCCNSWTHKKVLAGRGSALKEGIDYAIRESITSCTFKTDSQLLAKACMAYTPPTDVDWIEGISWNISLLGKLKNHPGLDCLYVPRSQNGMANYLAKKGKHWGWNYIGFTYPLFKQWVNLGSIGTLN